MAENEEYRLRSNTGITTDISDKDISRLFKKCGTFGRYQRWLYSYLFITKILTGSSGMSLTFSTANVPFLCYPPNFNASLIPANLTENEYLQMLQPDGDDQCSVYNNSFTGTYYTTPSSNSSKLQCSYGRKFLTENFSTIVSEFDLVCERKWLKSTLQSVYFAGYLVGSFVTGILADRIGRKPCFFLTATCITVCGVIKIFVSSLTLLTVFYFMQAFGVLGFLVTLYSLLMELTSVKLRTPANFMLMASFTVGTMMLTGLAYVMPHWKNLELTVCLLPVINCFSWKWIPESPRWLIGRKRFAEAQAIFRNIMKINKKRHVEILDILKTNEEFSQENNFQENMLEKTIKPKRKNFSFIDLFKTFRLAIITCNICFSWFAMSMLYYGVILNSVDMAGDRYINFLLMATVELPCYLTSYYLFNCIDHRKPISFFMMFSGINCIVSNFITKGSFWFPLILVILGKFGVSAAFASIFLLSAEIFPTVVRANGIGMASMFARLGSMCAPFILQLSSYAKWLPLSIYSVLSIISGLLLLLLPETKDKDLPQEIDDLDKW
ncbi:solute carrier family 22 member 3-like [Octopus sinensis]|uniref:Solute carrier family 22 member 3-like n=1 Tax=Octopus sinensis TaxID=2607531 RepID=A0A6P7T0C1_9MOLL|nr:solute carrier family 22 member 3-like [Octopus sinensis]